MAADLGKRLLAEVEEAGLDEVSELESGHDSNAMDVLPRSTALQSK